MGPEWGQYQRYETPEDESCYRREEKLGSKKAAIAKL